MNRTPLQPALALLFLVGGLAHAKPEPKDAAPTKTTWRNLIATLHQGELRLYLDISAREVSVFEHTRPPILLPLFKISKSMNARIDDAISKAHGSTTSGVFINKRDPDERQIDGEGLQEILRIVAVCAQERSEPVVRTLRGELVSKPRGDSFYLDGWRESAAMHRRPFNPRRATGHGNFRERAKRTFRAIRVVHVRPEVGQALRRVGPVEVRALVWSIEGEPDLIAPLSISVRATPSSLPQGVAPGSTVKVIGLANVPKHTIRTTTGTTIAGGEVVRVVDERGVKGLLLNPSKTGLPVASDRKPGATQALERAHEPR